MTASSKITSFHKPVVDFEFNLESVKSNKRFYLKKYQRDNHTNNQQKFIDCLKPKCGSNYFYVHNYQSFYS